MKQFYPTSGTWQLAHIPTECSSNANAATHHLEPRWVKRVAFLIERYAATTTFNWIKAEGSDNVKR